ncbi:hypothetical protein AB0T83_10845 [Fluviibacterium sp. DFM31]|uniref:Uncharacterized protein n=1 Tax=Meridianimarinicoccus marinus TaxID=3231483 RepID=A0ABV3L6T4_9RHOB
MQPLASDRDNFKLMLARAVLHRPQRRQRLITTPAMNEAIAGFPPPGRKG